MNALTPRAPGGGALLPGGTGSDALEALVACVTADCGALRHGAPDALVREAAALLRSHDAPPATTRAIVAWLRPIVAAVRGGAPATESDLQVRAHAVAVACADLPAEVFTVAAATAGLRSWQWWPSAAEVRQVVEAEAAPWRARRRALAAVAASWVSDYPDGSEGHQAANVEQKKAISALVGSMRAEVAEREQAERDARAPLKARAYHLTPAQLADEYRRLAAQGNTAAAVRLEMLERDRA